MDGIRTFTLQLVDKGVAVDMMLLDFSKAFDVVNHSSEAADVGH